MHDICMTSWSNTKVVFHLYSSQLLSHRLGAPFYKQIFFPDLIISVSNKFAALEILFWNADYFKSIATITMAIWRV